MLFPRIVNVIEDILVYATEHFEGRRLNIGVGVSKAIFRRGMGQPKSHPGIVYSVAKLDVALK